MALTGIGLLLFVIFHMVGNFKLYMGSHDDVYAIDQYGHFLRELLVPLLPWSWALWFLRFGLIAMFAIHIHSAYALTVINRRSNVNYASKRDYVAANFASRTMRVSGIIVVLYLLFHLADLTWGWTSGNFVRGNVYDNMVDSMSRPIVAGIYIIGNTLLSIHIFHGIWSAMQSLGFANPRYNHLRRGLATIVSAAILIGNLSFPFAILTGIVDEGDVPTVVEPDEAGTVEGGDTGPTAGGDNSTDEAE